MANHVHFSVNFHRINDEAKAKLKELFGRVRKDTDYKWLSDIFVEGDTTYEMTEKYAWTTEHIGPKWSYFEDYDADDVQPYFNGESAWSPPTDGVIKLLGILKEYDPKIVASMTYEDEGPNFVGGDVFFSDTVFESIEYDDEDIINLVISEAEGLTEESYDHDTGEWEDDAAEQVYHDEMWEIINNFVWDFCMEEVNYIFENPSDFVEETIH
jgi:hypothetical protein